jgi:hypothetical protein
MILDGIFPSLPPASLLDAGSLSSRGKNCQCTNSFAVYARKRALIPAASRPIQTGMRAVLRARVASAAVVCAIGAALPAAALALAWRREAHFGDALHFWGVGGAALAATAAALTLTIVGTRRRDPRTVIVGTAFSATAALLTLHGLSSPGVLVGFNGLVSFTGGATLPVGAAVLALTALPSLQRAGNVRRLLVLQGALLAAVVVVGAAGMLRPSLVPGVP